MEDTGKKEDDRLYVIGITGIVGEFLSKNEDRILAARKQYIESGSNYDDGRDVFFLLLNMAGNLLRADSFALTAVLCAAFGIVIAAIFLLMAKIFRADEVDPLFSQLRRRLSRNHS